MIFLFSWVISRFHVTFPGCFQHVILCPFSMKKNPHLWTNGPRSKPGFQVLRTNNLQPHHEAMCIFLGGQTCDGDGERTGIAGAS